MSRPPVRRFGESNPKVSEKTVVVKGTGGSEFIDMSDKKALHDFVRETKPIVDAQSKEIDLTAQVIAQRRQQNTNVDLNDGMPDGRYRPPPAQIQRPPTLEEQREYLRKRRQEELNNPVIDGEYSEEDEEETSPISIADIVHAPTPKQAKSKNADADWLDDEAKHLIKILNLGEFPLDVQRTIVASNRGSNNPALGLDEVKTEKPSTERKVISNIDIDPNETVDAPAISVPQMRKKIEKEMAEKQKKGEPLIDEPKTAPRFRINTVQTNDEDFMPITFVSGYVFYDFDHAFVRRFNITDAHPLHKARASNDLEAFINAVGASVKIPGGNVLDLSIPDFRNLLYWHQWYSFPKTPLILEWNSKYGNRNTYRITERDLKYNSPVLTREEYEKTWKPKGLTVPTMRDFLFFRTEDLTADEVFLFENAQWFIGDKNDASFQSKIDSMARFNAKSLDTLADIPEFQELSAHSIRELVDVVDRQFDPQKYKDVLQKQLDILYADKETLEKDDENSPEIEYLNDQIIEINDMVIEIEDKINRKERVEADVETHPVNLDLLEFFPGL